MAIGSATTRRFTYRALGGGSGVAHGEIDAASPAAARDALRRKGLVALEVKPTGGRSASGAAGLVAHRGAASGRAAKKVRAMGAWRRARAQAFAELSLLLESGMALDSALQTIVAIPSREEHREALLSLAKGVREGRTLAEGLRGSPAYFTPIQTAMAQVGEETGRLPEILKRLNEQEERSARLRQQVVSALTYPCILLGAGAIMLAGIVGFVMPRFTAMFDEVGVKLPWFSALVIGASRRAADVGPIVLALALAGFFVLRARWRDDAKRAAMERWALERTPIGPLWWRHQAAGFTGAMGMMLGGGAPILRALEVARSTWGSVELRGRLDGVISRMREGKRLSDACREARLLPERSDALVAVGEESGALATVFGRMALAMEEDVSARLKRALTLLEPLAILTIGLLVGAVVIAMLLAMFSINDVQGV